MLPSVHKLLDFYAKYYSQLNKTNKSFVNFDNKTAISGEITVQLLYTVSLYVVVVGLDGLNMCKDPFQEYIIILKEREVHQVHQNRPVDSIYAGYRGVKISTVILFYVPTS